MNLLTMVLKVVAGWTFTIAMSLPVGLVGLVTLGTVTRRYGNVVLRAWGQGMLRLLGVRLEVEGYQHLDQPRGCVVTFNHASQLDGYVTLGLLPKRGVTVIKSQFLLYPFVGLAVRLLDFVTIDRSAPAKARRSIEHLAERITREGLAVLIAPEGTRSQTGELLRFKQGALYLASLTRVPIVPMVISGAHTLMPPGQLHVKPGVIRVRILPPIDISRFRPDRLEEHASELRDLYVRTLSQMAAVG